MRGGGEGGAEAQLNAARHSLKRHNKKMRQSGKFETGEGIIDGDGANDIRYAAMIAALTAGGDALGEG